MLLRVAPQNLNSFFDLLSEKLPLVYENRTWSQICIWLSRAMTSNDYYFVYTKEAIGLFQKTSCFQRTIPDVEEIFCLGKKEECNEIYLAAFEWGKRFGAKFFFVDNCSTFTKEDFKHLFKKIGEEKRPYVVIE